MFRLKDIFKEIAQSHPVFARKWQAAEALTRWQDAVGEIISRHTDVIKVENHVLWVAVDHPVWKTELHYRKTQILELLNAKTGEKIFTDIRLIETKNLRRSKSDSKNNNHK